MSKRNFRKKAESSSEDESDIGPHGSGGQRSSRLPAVKSGVEGPSKTAINIISSSVPETEANEGDGEQKSSVSSIKKAPVVLSFGDEEEDGDGLDLRKSKDNKAFKKRMRQAPGAAQVVAAAAAAASSTLEPVGVGGGGMYSAESLAELKRQQHFSTVSVSKAITAADATTSEGTAMELAGDEAVLVSGDGSKNERIEGAMEVDGDSTSRRHVTFADDDIIGGNTSTRMKDSARKIMDDEDDDEAVQDWENEILSRVGKNLRSNRPVSSVNNNANLQELTISEARESISNAIRSLKISTSDADSKVQGIERALADGENEEKRLKTAVETAAEALDALKEFREYCSDLVGMLRDKEPLLLELQSTVAQTLTHQRDLAQKRRIEYQEKALAALRHRGVLISMGGYMPSKNFESYDDQNIVAHANSEISLASDGFISLLQRDDSHISKFLELATKNTTEHDFMLGLDACSRDFENENEIAEMKTKIASLQKAADLLLSDALSDISDVSEAIKQFAAFRHRFPKKYSSAFVSLSLPPLIGALVQYDVIVYPMLMETISFADRKWHAPIMEFSLQEEDLKDEKYIKVVEDEETLPKVIQGAVYSWFLTLLDDCFSPLSRTQCARAYNIITQLLEYDLPVDKANVMIQKLVHRFEAAVSSICVPLVKSDPDRATQSFLARQIVLLLVCIENFHIFKSIVAASNSFSFAWATVVPKLIDAILKICNGAALSASAPTSETLGMTHKLIHLYISAKLIYSSCRLIPGSEKVLEVVDSPTLRLSRTTPPLDFSQLRSFVAILTPSCDKQILPPDSAVALCQASSSLLRALRVVMTAAADEEGTGPSNEETEDVEAQLKYFLSTMRRLPAASQ